MVFLRLRLGQAVVEVFGGTPSIAAARPLWSWLIFGLRSRRVPLV